MPSVTEIASRIGLSLEAGGSCDVTREYAHSHRDGPEKIEPAMTLRDAAEPIHNRPSAAWHQA